MLLGHYLTTPFIHFKHNIESDSRYLHSEIPKTFIGLDKCLENEHFKQHKCNIANDFSHISIHIEGNSGCKLEIIDNCTILKTTTNLSYKERLKKQCEKQIFFANIYKDHNHIIVPQVCKQYWDRELIECDKFGFSMPYLYASDFIMFFENSAISDVVKVLSILLDFIDTNILESLPSVIASHSFAKAKQSTEKANNAIDSKLDLKNIDSHRAIASCNEDRLDFEKVDCHDFTSVKSRNDKNLKSQIDSNNIDSHRAVAYCNENNIDSNIIECCRAAASLNHDRLESKNTDCHDFTNAKSRNDDKIDYKPIQNLDSNPYYAKISKTSKSLKSNPINVDLGFINKNLESKNTDCHDFTSVKSRNDDKINSKPLKNIESPSILESNNFYQNDIIAREDINQKSKNIDIATCSKNVAQVGEYSKKQQTKNNSITESISKKILLDKYYDTIEKITQNKSELEFLSHIEKELQALPDRIQIPLGKCHGDLTFSNILFTDRKIILIDFLDNFIETPLQDIVKLRQDTKHLWSLRLYKKKYDGTKIEILLNYLDNLIDKHFSKYEFYRKYYFIFQKINLLRILPYAKDKQTFQYVANEIIKLNKKDTKCQKY